MTSKKNKITKISIIVLLLLLLFFGVNYFSVKVELSDFTKSLTTDNSRPGNSLDL